MIPIFNELEYARMMNNGHSETRSQEDKRKYTYQELLIYTKWLRWSLFISDKNEESKEEKIRNGITSFCNQLQLNFNQETDYYIIENLIKDSKKCMLRECKPSIITKNEWSKILEIPNENARKLFFAFLIIGKFNRNNPVKLVKQRINNYSDERLRIKIPINEIYRYAKIRFPRNCRNDNLSLYYSPLICLKNMGLIEVPDIKYIQKYGACYIINFADLNIKDVENETYLKIYDYNKLDEYYRYGMKDPKYDICKDCKGAYKKISKDSERCELCKRKYYKNSIRYDNCTKCGVRIKVTGTTQTDLCKSCQEKIRREKKTNAMKKLRKNQGKSVIKYCTDCGTEINSNSKSGLCLECYKKYRRQKKNESDSKNYKLKKDFLNRDID